MNESQKRVKDNQMKAKTLVLRKNFLIIFSLKENGENRSVHYPH
jgi:hypothetical protein